MVIARTSVAQTYATILDSSENQSIEGVRRLSADEVLLACSYTENDDPTQGMWWTGSLATGVGTAYKIVPQLAGQTVTSSVFYGPNTAFVNPALGTNIQIVGSYKYAESPTPDLNVGLLYVGPLDGKGGTWKSLNPQPAVVDATVANVIPHSVMGDLVVGNYDLVGVPASGNAFIYNIQTDTYVILNFGGTQNLTSLYGVWQNGPGSSIYTLVGGSRPSPTINLAMIVDFDASSSTFGTPTYYAPRGEGPTILSHFEGISGLGDGRYSLIAMTLNASEVPIGVDLICVVRLPNGSFSAGQWTPLAYPGASFATGNTVIDGVGMGIYFTSSNPSVFSYVAFTEIPCPADLNDDGVVNGSDLSSLLASWGTCPPKGGCPGDFDDDGVVNGSDLSYLLASWGTCP